LSLVVVRVVLPKPNGRGGSETCHGTQITATQYTHSNKKEERWNHVAAAAAAVRVYRAHQLGQLHHRKVNRAAFFCRTHGRARLCCSLCTYILPFFCQFVGCLHLHLSPCSLAVLH
jgi:hypothetical protein